MINTINTEIWLRPNNNSDTAHNLQKILTTDMTRDRGLERAKKYLPSLIDFLEIQKEENTQSIIDLWSGEEVLADDIQKELWINVRRVDWYRAKPKKDKINWWRSTMRFDIRKMEKFPPNIKSLYSLFTLQYIQDAPDTLEKIRKKLAIWWMAYLQFPQWLWTNKLLQEFEDVNKWKNVMIIRDNTNKSFWSIVFIIHKESADDLPFTIPEYRSQNNIELYYTDNQEKVKNSELFYHFFSKDSDPEWEEL